eukprot:8543664-Alexandrium_andersonii.AAC.1
MDRTYSPGTSKARAGTRRDNFARTARMSAWGWRSCALPAAKAVNQRPPSVHPCPSLPQSLPNGAVRITLFLVEWRHGLLLGEAHTHSDDFHAALRPVIHAWA